MPPAMGTRSWAFRGRATSAQRQVPGWSPVFVCAPPPSGDTQMSDSSGYVQFIDDDQGYLRWLEQNPGGYVVNSFRVPTGDYLILHRASCKHINSPSRTNWTTTGYIKTCSTDPATLDAWAVGATGGGVSPCGACKPDYRPQAASSPQAVSVAGPPGSSPGPTPSPDIPTPPAGTRTVPA